MYFLAGKWGDYRKCDSPKRTIDHLLQHIADTHAVRPLFINPPEKFVNIFISRT